MFADQWNNERLRDEQINMKNKLKVQASETPDRLLLTAHGGGFSSRPNDSR